MINFQTHGFQFLAKFLLIFMVLSLQSLFALEVTGELSAQYEYSNNIEQSTTNTEDDVSQLLALEMGVTEQGKSVIANANLKLEHDYYFNETYSDELSLTSGFGLFSIDLIESFLNWRASYTRTQVLKDTSDNEVGDNLGLRDVIRTGPEISYSISRAAKLKLSSDYVVVENSDEEASDTERLGGRLSFSHKYNSLTDLFFNASYEDMIEGDGAEEYNTARVSAGLSRRFSHGLMSFSFGKVRLNSDEDEGEKSNFFDVSISREQVLWHDLTFNYHQDSSDTSIGFEEDESGNVNELARLQGVAINDVVERKRFSFGLERVLENWVYDVNGIAESESYKTFSYKEKYKSVQVGFEPIISARIIPRFEYSYATEDFGGRSSLGKDVLKSYSLHGNFRSTLDLTLKMFVQFEKRTNNVNFGREYEDLAFGLGINWTFL